MSRVRSKPSSSQSGGLSGMTLGLIALAAVAMAIGLGYFIGNAVMGGDDQQQVAAPPAPAQGAAGGAVAQATTALDSVNPVATGAPVGKGQPPIGVDDQPVGDGEARLWIPEAADSNWVFHMGDIPSDSKTEHEFSLTNVGKGTLVIEDVSASCGCTTSTVGEKELAPGASTTLRVSYDPRVNGETGRFVQKQVRIKSNDPLVPLAEFTVTADVAAE